MTDCTPKKLQELYKKMGALTLPECRSCQMPYSCCSGEYCEFTIKFASDRGVNLQRTKHPRLPLMAIGGCTAPEHLRPMCTVYTCDINSLGFKKHNDPDGAWTKKYLELRALIEEAEFAFTR